MPEAKSRQNRRHSLQPDTCIRPVGSGLERELVPGYRTDANQASGRA